jgi:hypothetical protein
VQVCITRKDVGEFVRFRQGGMILTEAATQRAKEDQQLERKEMKGGKIT